MGINGNCNNLFSLEKLQKVLIVVFFFLQTFVHKLLSLEIFTLGKKTTLHC